MEGKHFPFCIKAEKVYKLLHKFASVSDRHSFDPSSKNIASLSTEHCELSRSAYAERTVCNHSCLQHLKNKGESLKLTLAENVTVNYFVI